MTARIVIALLGISTFWACGSDSVMMPALERGLHEVGNLTRPRNLHVATQLQNGKVLIAGGNAALPPAGGGVIEQDLLVSAEIFDPETGVSTRTGNMNASRSEDHGILLPDGRGSDYIQFFPLNSPIEMYDPHSGRFDAVCRRTLDIRDPHCHAVAQRRGPINRRVTRGVADGVFAIPLQAHFPTHSRWTIPDMAIRRLC